MNIIEEQFLTKEKAPECCTYCDEEKSFLMVKPTAMSINGEMTVNVNLTSRQHWICLECLSLEIDAMGHSVDIHEYE
ncbi:hypothetical protein ACQKMD_11010 [Viridibacillus sp. NPDC096237]|uniref:hypothetical protein n=1 Tax=Viridibacillus sp. NPDC096237 TaxID=3390721 RepID=UPI003CFFB756